MWNYEKRLQYPVKITQTNPKMAQVIISQFGGPDGELAASMRYWGNGIFQGIYEHTAKTIVAWMPLPEPYKGE